MPQNQSRWPLIIIAVIGALIYFWPASAATNNVYLPAISSPPLATVEPTVTATVIVTPTRDPALCDPAYPTVCIPPPPPDLDCGDISFRRFTVLPPDPHNFDTDDDGIGCESDN